MIKGMKKLALLMMFASVSAGACIAQPQPVLSFATVLKPVGWYREQAELWKKEIDRNPKNADAWYYYYRAHRSLNRLDTTGCQSAEMKQEQEVSIIADMEKAIPGTYEYNLCRWLTGGNNFADTGYLRRAAELAGSKSTHYPDMIVWGEIERNAERKDLYAKKWYEAGTASPGLLYYNYNVLAGLKPNAILFTTGDNDTYPVWLLQSQGIRKDVTVLNLSLLYIDGYRDKIFKELGVGPWNMLPASGSVNDKRLAASGKAGEKKAARYHEDIVKHVAANTRDLPVYVGLTVPDEYTAAIGEDLFLTGLAYEYSKKSIDNMALLKKNFEQLYALDYLDKKFFTDISEYWVRMTNANYLVPMVKLYEHYKASGDTQKALAIREKAISTFIRGNNPGPSFVTIDELNTYFR